MKKALCIAKKDLDIDFTSMAVQSIPGNLFDLRNELVDRSLCETDEGLLQLIPYIVVRDVAGKIYCYERGAGGGEERLHAKLSIGIGGHADEIPQGCESDLLQILLCNGERELLEETGITATLGHFTGVIYTGSNGAPVDRVHLGLIASVELLLEPDITTEHNVIEGGGFVTLGELLLPENFDLLEPWSQAVVTRMREQLSEEIGQLIISFGEVLDSLSIESPTGITATTGQEMGAVARAVGDNLISGAALARVYDESFSAGHLDCAIIGAGLIMRALGVGHPGRANGEPT